LHAQDLGIVDREDFSFRARKLNPAVAPEASRILAFGLLARGRERINLQL
jgi:hypothetical protein